MKGGMRFPERVYVYGKLSDNHSKNDRRVNFITVWRLKPGDILRIKTLTTFFISVERLQKRGINIVYVAEGLIFTLNSTKAVNRLPIPLYYGLKGILEVNQPLPLQKQYYNKNLKIVCGKVDRLSDAGSRVGDTAVPSLMHLSEGVPVCIVLGNDPYFDFPKKYVAEQFLENLRRIKPEQIYFCAKSDSARRLVRRISKRLSSRDFKSINSPRLIDLPFETIFLSSPSTILIELHHQDRNVLIPEVYSDGLPDFLRAYCFKYDSVGRIEKSNRMDRSNKIYFGLMAVAGYIRRCFSELEKTIL